MSVQADVHHSLCSDDAATCAPTMQINFLLFHVPMETLQPAS